MSDYTPPPNEFVWSGTGEKFRIVQAPRRCRFHQDVFGFFPAQMIVTYHRGQPAQLTADDGGWHVEYRLEADASDPAFWNAYRVIDSRAEPDADYEEIVRHHIECEHAGEELARAVEGLITCAGPVPDASAALAALDRWNRHQWPDLARNVIDERWVVDRDTPRAITTTDGEVIGMMDTPEIARHVVDAHHSTIGTVPGE